jgi:hypothetical protein
MKNYKSLISSIFGPEWESFTNEDKNSYIAVACVISFMNGIYPSNDELSKHLGIPRNEIEIPLDRLHGAGIFNNKFKIKQDLALTGKGFSVSSNAIANDAQTWNPTKSILNAWLNIAGIGSGYIYRNYY